MTILKSLEPRDGSDLGRARLLMFTKADQSILYSKANPGYK